ncbi:cytochrome P450, partial [Trifolium medium]|nr:cytochrome P450 [Trifolium medium]
MCIRDDQGRYVAVRAEWLEPIINVELGEAMGLSALKWVNELQLRDMDFEMDNKRVVDRLYSSRTYNSDLCDILRDCRTFLSTSLTNSN